uniref:Centriolar satellite-associated tubulin polyglutamylase complex regulator 1 n=1 Tax=Suricata suricatta TaxID=37032 RepID=A0A673TBL9_SURSU
MLSPERLALPDYEYLAQRHVLTYMEDAVCQLLENKEDISQYGIARFFTEYFNSVCQGTHILFREFSFIQATPHNRASFLRAFWRCFRTVGKNGGTYKLTAPPVSLNCEHIQRRTKGIIRSRSIYRIIKYDDQLCALFSS